jgi:hypothetical protein
MIAELLVIQMAIESNILYRGRNRDLEVIPMDICKAPVIQLLKKNIGLTGINRSDHAFIYVNNFLN